MGNYGKLVNGIMQCGSIQLEGFKPIRYEEIPAGFDQQAQFAYQLDPVETDTEIFIGVGIGVLQVEGTPEEGTPA
jgi:hypothetical protein